MRRLRPLLALLPLLALGLTALRTTSSESVRNGLLSGGDGLGTPAPELARRIESETDPAVASVIAARAAVADFLDPERRLAAAAGATQETTLVPLLRAQEIARTTLESRPAHWQAAMLLGATTYLTRLQERDTKLFSEARDWEAPLEWASELAPGQIEPRRFLTAAYLDTWPALSPRKREITIGLLDEVLNDRESFRMLIGAWLRTSGDNSLTDDESLALIPDTPWAWSHLLDELATTRQWARYADVRERWHGALKSALRDSIDEARARREGGDTQGARTLLTSVVRQTPVGTEYAALFSDALEQLPPGPIGATAERQLRLWHDWTLRLCITVDCPLGPAVVSRLSGAVRDALPHEVATAALAAGDLASAEAIERRNATALEEKWSDYLLFKTRSMLDRDDVTRAASTLRDVARVGHDTVRYIELTEELVRLGLPQFGTGRNAKSDRWDSSEWREQRDGYHVELNASRHSGGLSLTVPALATGGAVEVRWDGARVGTFATGGATAIELPIDVSAGPHLLEVARITGARPRTPSARLSSARLSSSRPSSSRPSGN